MRDTIVWIGLVVAGVGLLIAGVGAALALLTGHARFIEVAWVSIAASLFDLAFETWRKGDRKSALRASVTYVFGRRFSVLRAM